VISRQHLSPNKELKNMKKPKPVHVLRFAIAAIFLLLILPPLFSGPAYASEPQVCGIDGAWRLSLPMPGGAAESNLVLASDGDSMTGSMSNPGEPSDIHPVYDGTCGNGKFSLHADMGRISYHLEGTCINDRLTFDLKTTESIPLGEGHRLEGNSGEISGKYLVPVYSPGGIMENHFVLAAENGIITGQMYVPVSRNEASPEKPDAAVSDMGPIPEGTPSGPPPSGPTVAATGDKRDVNDFHDGAYEGNRISLYTLTAQGSLFHFTGTVLGDTINLSMHVTDRKEALEAFRKK
jgi:hypothetical protein